MDLDFSQPTDLREALETVPFESPQRSFLKIENRMFILLKAGLFNLDTGKFSVKAHFKALNGHMYELRLSGVQFCGWPKVRNFFRMRQRIKITGYEYAPAKTEEV